MHHSTQIYKQMLYIVTLRRRDTAAHNELLVKLWSFGITGELWRWFRGYLSARMQCVILNGFVSDPLPVNSGVPQGSILRLLLFPIFVNDIFLTRLHHPLHFSLVMMLNTLCVFLQKNYNICQVGVSNGT